MPRDVFSITLAAGASSRMPEDMRPKACCRIGARSVIDHCLTTYEEAGIRKHVIVVGHAADRVMEEVVKKRKDVLFAYQSAPKGTGAAVECALDLLEGIGPPEHVVMSAGDKIIAPYVVRGLVETYAASECDFCLAAGPSRSYPDSGRIIEREGLVQGIIEAPDINARRLVARLRGLPAGSEPKTVKDLLQITDAIFPNVVKLGKCFPGLKDILAADPDEALDWPRVLAGLGDLPSVFHLPCGPVTVEEAASAPLANIFVYAAAFGSLREAVRELKPANVQGERYLTDVAQILTEKGREVRIFQIGHPDHVMSFNTLPELEEIRRVYAGQAPSEPPYATLQQWSNYLSGRKGMELYRAAVENLMRYARPDRAAILVRSPGRINLMGRHVDHQGGACNLMAIDHAIVMAAAPRDDDRINLWNVDADQYPSRSFTISELTEDVDWEDWLRTLNTQFIRRAVSMSAGDWVNYVKGGVLRLQHRFQDRRLRGMDAYVAGNIPVAAGLSSSSALLVAATEAMIELNSLNIRLSEFVDLCGEGEWFVGTRGGSADHAAIKHGRESQVVSVSFFPFRILAHHPFPADCHLIVCHSGQFAKKTENARERFNARVACYHMARETVKKRFPQFAPRIEHLRDINCANLEISLPALYQILRELPNEMSPAEVEAMAKAHPTVEKCLAGVDPSRNNFPLRDMAMYGLAECERASMTGGLLNRGDIVRIGELMRISHDGDRVAKWSPDRGPWNSRVSDERIAQLISRSAALAPLAEAGAALWQQPGAYECSTPEIDLMVDGVGDCPGVLGAQLSGAGLGGCIMVLARREAVPEAQDRLLKHYYEPRGIEPRMFVCRPSAGSHVLTTLDGPV